jgi:hypothetical protein
VLRRTPGDFATPHSFTSVRQILNLIKHHGIPKENSSSAVPCGLHTRVKSRFATLHEAFGFKTKAATRGGPFAVSIKDKIDPQILLRLEAKLDQVLENFDSL